jgi:Fe-S cluster biogenesis protein NfuA/Fe-S cluster assembly iron-binding protein IscA
MSRLFDMTEDALHRLRTVLPAASAAGAAGVRLSARRRDTGVPEYRIEPAAGPSAGDTVVTLDGLVAYVDPQSAPLLAGARIDHVDAPHATGFLIRPGDEHLAARVETALDGVRPRLQADGGDVELVEVRAGRAVLRLFGTCVGCGLADITLTRLLEHLRQAVPELPEVTAEAVPRPAAPIARWPEKQT